jgi:hypothetical protein
MTPDELRAAVVAGLFLFAPGFVACAPNRNCLEGSLAANYAESSSLLLLRREFERANEAPPALRARILEELPSLMPDLSDRVDEPRCAPELVGTLADELDRTPLPFDNATLHLMNALGNVHDTTDVMDEKGRILLRLASLHDHRIGGYQRLPEERGPSPGPASLRLRALGLLARSNLFLNDELVRQFLLEKALTSKDSREEWLVAGPASRVFTTQAEPRYGRRLLATWLERSRARLSAPADPLSLEALLVHVNYLGAYADTYGMEGAVKDLLDSVVNADGAVSSTAGIDGGAHDLASRAVVALADIEDGPRVRKWFEPDAPFPTRVRRSPYDGVLDDTTIVDWPRAVLESRLRTLDDEIAALGKESRGRCALVHQRATMTPERAQAALFDAWTTMFRSVSFSLRSGSTRCPCRSGLASRRSSLPKRTQRGFRHLARSSQRACSASTPSGSRRTRGSGARSSSGRSGRRLSGSGKRAATFPASTSSGAVSRFKPR